ncbi:hypothetical protein IA940_14690 [Listeria marthii]|uniref:hypothetical protein n=1 Tax=Listeria marthii TaxID=529731 RepID=UPI0018886A46|nr:hypothetical protein [Listeria marthii]EAW7215132.1 hypothetical protein [Listeria monocytogenes]MBF2521143.1 hypothetical protein [Listeria marthii]
MMNKKGKIIFVVIFSVVLVIGVVGWQVLKLYTESDSTDKANIAESEGVISKNKTTAANTTESESVIKKQVEEEIQAQVKKEQDDLKKRVEAFTKTFLTYSSETASTDFKKAAQYMTKQAQSANEPNTDENYEQTQGLYKQVVAKTDIYLDVQPERKEGSFISIVSCHSEGDGGISSDFPLMLRGELTKQENNTWLISKVTIGNPANFPKQFFP